MKGLFLKDYYLNFSNRRSLFLFLFMSIFMAFAMDGSFIIGYTGMLMGILAIGTISYDSNENGMAFLMCLPISRKDYVKEKYGYSISSLNIAQMKDKVGLEKRDNYNHGTGKTATAV